jgi:hypothetical protein
MKFYDYIVTIFDGISCLLADFEQASVDILNECGGFDD